MIIKVLAENTPLDPRFGCEHGLSIYIESEHRRLLFDMGQSDLFARNAAVMGVALETIDLAVISHGHYDHGGGLATFLKVNDCAPVYLSAHAFEGHYNAGGINIGLDSRLERESRLRLGTGERQIGPGLWLFDRCPRPYGVDNAGQCVCDSGRLLPEDFRHEQYLLVQEHGRRILFSGCSHAGIRNIVEHFKPDVLVGGFHFMKWRLDESLAQEGKSLAQSGATFYTGHCTGVPQEGFLRQFMPNLYPLRAGGEYEI